MSPTPRPPPPGPAPPAPGRLPRGARPVGVARGQAPPVRSTRLSVASKKKGHQEQNNRRWRWNGVFLEASSLRLFGFSWSPLRYFQPMSDAIFFPFFSGPAGCREVPKSATRGAAFGVLPCVERELRHFRVRVGVLSWFAGCGEERKEIHGIMVPSWCRSVGQWVSFSDVF